MAVKSVLSIDVEDQAFANLKRRYDQFDASVRKLPAEWRKLSVEMVGTQDLFKSMLGMSVAIAGALKEAERVEVHRSRVTDNSLRQWKHLAREARDFAASVRGATLSVAKWAGLGGILGGAGALFGLDRMAQNVAGARQFAMGVGTTIGGAKAFEVNMGRIVDPRSFLQSVSQARMSPEGRLDLLRAGMTQAQLAGKPEDLAVALIQRLKKFADETPIWMRTFGLQTTGLGRFFGLTNVETAYGSKQAEINQITGRFRKNVSEMNIDEPTAKRWQDFLTTLEEAEGKINKAFIVGLTPLVGPFERLAKAAPDLLLTFLKAPFLKKWMNDIAEGLNKFATYVGTDEFRQNVEAFVRGLGALAKFIGDFIRRFTPEEKFSASLRDRASRGRNRFPITSDPVRTFTNFTTAVTKTAAGAIEGADKLIHGKLFKPGTRNPFTGRYLDPDEARAEDQYEAMWATAAEAAAQERRANIMGTKAKNYRGNVFGEGFGDQGQFKRMHPIAMAHKETEQRKGWGTFKKGYDPVPQQLHFAVSPQVGADFYLSLLATKGGS